MKNIILIGLFVVIAGLGYVVINTNSAPSDSKRAHDSYKTQKPSDAATTQSQGLQCVKSYPDGTTTTYIDLLDFKGEQALVAYGVTSYEGDATNLLIKVSVTTATDIYTAAGQTSTGDVSDAIFGTGLVSSSALSAGLSGGQPGAGFSELGSPAEQFEMLPYTAKYTYGDCDAGSINPTWYQAVLAL